MRVISFRPRPRPCTNDETGEEGQSQDASPDLQYLELKFQRELSQEMFPSERVGVGLGFAPVKQQLS